MRSLRRVHEPDSKDLFGEDVLEKIKKIRKQLPTLQGINYQNQKASYSKSYNKNYKNTYSKNYTPSTKTNPNRGGYKGDRKKGGTGYKSGGTKPHHTSSQDKNW